MAVIDVHLIDQTWPTLAVAAASALVAALLGAVIGARATMRAGREQIAGAYRTAHDQRAADAERADAQYRRELLAKAADQLLDALWSKERDLCSGLDEARQEVEARIPPDDPNAHAVSTLGTVELGVYRDLITALPFIVDPELRERIRTAGAMTNGCLNLRAGSPGGSVEQINRAMIEVQRYFKWLRWNLMSALAGEELPAPVSPPDVRREPGDTFWELPAGIPDWT